jgi:hypothetical protein
MLKKNATSSTPTGADKHISAADRACETRSAISGTVGSTQLPAPAEIKAVAWMEATMTSRETGIAEKILGAAAAGSAAARGT